MAEQIIILGFAFIILFGSLYFMYRNNKTHSILINLSNELRYDISMANSKEDAEHILKVLKKLAKKDRYSTMLFSFKSFTQLDYELRKDIGMLR